MFPTLRINLPFGLVGVFVSIMSSSLWAIDRSFGADEGLRTITGSVQNQDLRRVDQAIVQVRDQEGNVVTQSVTTLAGVFGVTVPGEGGY